MALRKVAAPAAQRVSFGRREDYSAGGDFVPDGQYLWSDLTVGMYTPTRKDGTVAGATGLAVRVTFEPPGGASTEAEQIIQNYSMGTKAHLTFQPDATGKGLVAIPGGAGGSLYEGSNWQILLKSLWDAQMPEDFFVDDLSVLEGIVVSMQNIPEPESRKELRAQSTSEMPAGITQRPRKIPVVAEVIEAPWMAGQQTRPAVPPKRVAAPTAPAPKSAANKTNGVAAAPATDDQLSEEVSNHVASFLEKNANGGQKGSLRMSVFRDMAGNPHQQAAMNTFFSDDEALNGILGLYGFRVSDDGKGVVIA